MRISEKKRKLRAYKFYSLLYLNCDNSNFVELRPMTLNYKLDVENREWISLKNKKRLVKRTWDLRNRHLFFGVATRSRKSKEIQKGTKKYLEEAPTLYVDLDWSDFEGGREEALEIIHDFGFPASCLVESGHGFHVYYFLEEPYDLTQKSLSRFEQLLGILQSEIFHGDSTSDASRCLRGPYSINIKNPSKPVLVRIIKLEQIRYSFQDFEDQLWQILEKTKNSKSQIIDSNKSAKTEKGEINLDKLEVSDKIKTLIREGNNSKYRYKSRSEADQAVITGLLSSGYGKETIQGIFEQNPEGIGEKYFEKGNSKEKYLNHSIESAKEFLFSRSS